MNSNVDQQHSDELELNNDIHIVDDQVNSSSFFSSSGLVLQQALEWTKWQHGGSNQVSILGAIVYGTVRFYIRAIREVMISCNHHQQRVQFALAQLRKMMDRYQQQPFGLLEMGDELWKLILYSKPADRHYLPKLPHLEVRRVPQLVHLQQNTRKSPDWYYVHTNNHPQQVDSFWFCWALGTALMSNITLRHLTLDQMFVMIDQEVPPFGLALLTLAITKSTTLESLVLKQWSFHDETPQRDFVFQFVRDICICSMSLTSLELTQMEFGNVGMLMLAHGIKCNNTRLQRLLLQECNVGENGFVTLFAEGIRRNTSLTHLHVVGCNVVNDRSIQAMIKHWPPESSIQSLSLSRNEIGIVGTRALFAAARHRPELHTLDLSHNGNMGYETLTMIGKALCRQTHLRHVLLEKQFQDPLPVLLLALIGLTPAQEEEEEGELLKSNPARDKARLALLQGIQSNTQIHELRIPRNSFSQKEVKEIDFYAACNKIGGHVLSKDHGLATTVWCHMLAKCQHPRYDAVHGANSYVYVYLREHPELVQTSG